MWLFTLVIDLKLKDLKEFGFRGLWGLLRALGAPIGLWNVSRRVSGKKRGGAAESGLVSQIFLWLTPRGFHYC